MLHFTTESLHTVAPHISALLQAHWDEVEASMHGTRTYELNLAQYQLFEQLHMLHIITARDQNRKLCGYAAFTLSPCRHQKEIFVATLDAFYLAPAQRHGLNALTFLRHAEKSLQQRGVNVVHYSSPASKPCDALYRRLGATPMESIYHKALA